MNRNHCPLCLHSTHVDNHPGDRACSCGNLMKPIALGLKDIRQNPFTDNISAEIMLIHICLGCGTVKANRIAGDDSIYMLVSIYRQSFTMDRQVRTNIINSGITMAESKDSSTVYTSLLGGNYKYHLAKILPK